jgi:hypothetical protein
LVFAKDIIEENIDGFPALSFANPNNPGPFKIVDEGCILFTLFIRNLIYPDRPESSDSMAGTYTSDTAMQMVRKG